MRTIFIGDVHGCSTELKEMIRTLEISSHDRVIMLGDLINRGPDSVGVVEIVRERKFECLMGNHEFEYLHHYREIPALKKLREKMPAKLHDWIAQRPLWIESDAFLAVHAGLFPGKHPSETPEEIVLNIRTVAPEHGFQSELSSPMNKPWHHFYTGIKPVFYGHWARQGLAINPPTYGLDSGCVYGRALSAFILESKELVQIPAREQYYKKLTDPV
ncbi:MAG: metallophosphoesterase [Leptospirales bacterium]|nr:metallophosphoesterase [Leptospirales bacterium]